MRVLFAFVSVLLLAILVSASDVNPIWLSPTDSSQGDHAEEFPEQGVWSNISIGAGSRADVPIVVMDSNKTLWIMFGNRGFNGDPLMTVWNYDPKTDLYRWVAGPGNDTTYLRNPGELRVPSKDNYPGGVNWNRGTIDRHDNIWFFSSNECCELWMFNTTSFMFTRMSGESGVTNVPSFGSTPGQPGDDVYPGDNSGGCIVTDSQNNLWLVSGAVSNKFLNCVWHFNTSSLQWRYVSGNATEFHTTYGDTPIYGGRWLSACDIDENDRVWLFGGTGSLHNPYSDVWSFDTRSAQWQLEHGSDATYANKATIISPDFAAGNIPNARENAALVDRKDGTLLLFAGSGNITASGSWYGFNDLWLFNKTSKMWKHVSGDPFTTTYPEITATTANLAQ